MTEVPLNLDSVSFSWPGAAERVLKDISATFMPGEFVGILGPNGAGKSTFLRTAAGFVRPDSGRVLSFGLDPSRISRRRAARLAAFLPAALHVGFPLTVRELVSLGRTCHLEGVFESAHDRELVSSAMAFSGVEHFAGRRYGELSAGEQRRVLIARAVAQESRLLLLDEPAANLDASQAVRMLDGLASMARRDGVCVVAAMHDLNLALLVCDRVILMNRGAMVGLGTPEEVMRYKTLKDVFQCDFYVGRNELNGRLFVVPMQGSS
ncbi:MAG TPA: ABC transporter ATP-binding protein [Myxococcota bacterium]|nr:ABC transporter ATP-binding protein [Myxococcota bacterium]